MPKYKTTDKGTLFESIYVNHELECEDESCFCKEYQRDIEGIYEEEKEEQIR